MEVSAGFRTSLVKSNSGNAFEELLENLENGNLSQVYFADGEPLISENFWKFLNRAIELDRAKNIVISFNTNLSLLKFRNESIIEKLKAFKQVRIMMSLDGVGKTSEFVRDGFEWETWKSNYLQIKRELGPEVIEISTTLTTPVLYDIEAFLNFLFNENLKFSISIPIPDGVNFICPQSLDRKSLSHLIARARGALKKFPEAHFQSVEALLQLLESQTLISEIDSNWKSKIFENIKYFQALDKRRKSIPTLSWFFNCPETKVWIQEIFRSQSETYFESIHLQDFDGIPVRLNSSDELEQFISWQKKNPTRCSIAFTNSLRSEFKLAPVLSQLHEILVPGSQISVIEAAVTPFNWLMNCLIPYRKISLFSEPNPKAKGDDVFRFWRIVERSPQKFSREFPNFRTGPRNYLDWGFKNPVMKYFNKAFPRIFALHRHTIIYCQPPCGETSNLRQ